MHPCARPFASPSAIGLPATEQGLSAPPVARRPPAERLHLRTMNPVVLSLAFSAAILASLLIKFWLATRQMRHVAAHRGAVPAAFAATVPLDAHQKAADYTLAKLRLGII